MAEATTTAHLRPELDEVGPIGLLAEFAVDWRPSVLPAAALAEAKRAYLDLFGVSLVGSLEKPSTIAARVAHREAAPGPAIVIGHGFRLAPSFAALVNGTTGHVLDYDASATLATTGHSTVCVGPAALACAEQAGANGRELIEAMIVGYEISARVGASGGGENGEFYRRGFHGTSVYGVFGATAAAARLLGLDAAQARQAFGIAASGAKGVRANYGTMTKPLHAGAAAHLGVFAASLAGDGFTANPEVLDAPFGWAETVTGPIADPASLTDGLGESLAICQGVNFKQFPSCGSSHPAIRAVLRLFAEHHLRRDEVESIEIAMSATVARETLIYPWPAIPLEGKFSLAFLVAAAWHDQQVSIGTFSETTLRELVPYRDRISVLPLPGRPPVVARLRMLDGRELVQEQPTGKPTFDDPNGELAQVSDADLRNKFLANVMAVRSAEAAEELAGLIDLLEELASLSELTNLLG